MDATTTHLPVMETIKAAWAKVSGAKGTFWSILAVVFALQMGSGFLSGMLADPHGPQPLYLQLLSLIVGVIVLLLSWSLLYAGIQRAADQPIQFEMAKYAFNWSIVFKMLGLYVLQVLILFVISLLLFIPPTFFTGLGNAGKLLTAVVYTIVPIVCLFICLRLYIAKAIVLARQAGPVDALKTSFALTEGNVWRLLGIALLNIVIFVVSILPFGIGLIWSLPYLFINYGEVYRRLTTMK